jgi:hypothetical protein
MIGCHMGGCAGVHVPVTSRELHVVQGVDEGQVQCQLVVLWRRQSSGAGGRVAVCSVGLGRSVARSWSENARCRCCPWPRRPWHNRLPGARLLLLKLCACGGACPWIELPGGVAAGASTATTAAAATATATVEGSGDLAVLPRPAPPDNDGGGGGRGPPLEGCTLWPQAHSAVPAAFFTSTFFCISSRMRAERVCRNVGKGT